MLFSKLPIVLLSSIVSNNDNSINHQIASYVLSNLKLVQSIGIQELADYCNVSTSSVSRFCKDIGLEGFIELKNLIEDNHFQFESVSEKPTPYEREKDYFDHMQNCLLQVANSLKLTEVTDLCAAIFNHDKVAVFGMMKAETAAIALQSDLMMLGKNVVTKIQFHQQLEYLSNTSKDDLIIFFSYTGVYFDYLSRVPKNLKQAKVYFITGNESIVTNEIIDHTIFFQSNLNPSTHPYQLQYIAHIIAQEYAYYIKHK